MHASLINTSQDRWYQTDAVESLFDFYSTPREFDKNGVPKPKNALVCLPTGTGKSRVIAKFLKHAFEFVPDTRAMMSTHVKELIKQNGIALQSEWVNAPLGFYSSGLKSRDTIQPIIFGGVQSMINKYPLLGYRDFMIIDEAHLVSPVEDTTYQKLIAELMYGPDYDPSKPVTASVFNAALNNPRCNPFLKVIGLTATHYRQGLGLLTNGNIFTDIVYNLCTVDGFARLMADGYLCPLIPKKTNTEFDVSGVKIVGDDYAKGALEAAVDKHDITFNALKELVNYSYNRRCGLIFASGVKHANHIYEMMNSVFNESCVIVHSNTKDYPRSDIENDKAILDWKSGRAKWAVCMNSLTTGVDNPLVDIIGMMRSTISVGLWVQMLGRGTRPLYAPGFNLNDFAQRWQAIYAGGKQNCLVMDFAGNTRRLGPINDPLMPRMKNAGPPGDAPVRICPQCGAYSHATAKVCDLCGYEFPSSLSIGSKAGTEELMRNDLPQIESFKVNRCVLTEYTTKTSQRNMIRVAYYCNRLRTFYEYVTVEGKTKDKLDFVAKKGRDWFRQRYPGEPPETNEEVLDLMQELRTPATINIWINKEYPEIMSCEF